jgi:hypothetical protein
MAGSKPRYTLSPQECHELAQKLRMHAKRPDLSPQDRAECLRHANNLKFVARIRAKQNRHPEHPTRQ